MKIVMAMVFAAVLMAGCDSDVYLKPSEGRVAVTGGEIWYQIIGEGTKPPLIVVHGGPGGRSCGYVEGFQELSSDRPIILYDQLESGNSSRPNDTTLWKLPHFVDQLAALVAHLNLDEYHLLGHSWGAAIVMEYALEHGDDIASIVFEGPLLSTAQWMQDAKTLLSRMPSHIRDTIVKYEAAQEYVNPAYLAATDSFYKKHLIRKPVPDEVRVQCKEVPPFNAKIYNHMWGPTEFNATGTLRGYDRISRLGELDFPVLFVAGEFDEVLPETLAMYADAVPQGDTAIISGAGHGIIFDNPREVTGVLRAFTAAHDDD